MPKKNISSSHLGFVQKIFVQVQVFDHLHASWCEFLNLKASSWSFTSFALWFRDSQHDLRFLFCPRKFLSQFLLLWNLLSNNSRQTSKILFNFKLLLLENHAIFGIFLWTLKLQTCLSFRERYKQNSFSFTLKHFGWTSLHQPMQNSIVWVLWTNYSEFRDKNNCPQHYVAIFKAQLIIIGSYFHCLFEKLKRGNTKPLSHRNEIEKLEPTNHLCWESIRAKIKICFARTRPLAD